MKRNFVLKKYYKFANPKELHPKGVRAEYNCIDKAMQSLIKGDIYFFKYEYNGNDIHNNQKVHVTHIIKKVGERYYETVQEQREHDISLSWERNYR